MKQYLTKKKILIFIVILLPVLFVLPMRCSNIVTRMEFIGDTGTPRASRTCYSVYHKNFWTIMRERPIEYMFGAVPLAGWLEYESDGLPVNDGIYPYRRVETRIFHHSYRADFSVDSTKHISYSIGTTTYTSAWYKAVNTWNTYGNSVGGATIATSTTATSSADLLVLDIASSSSDYFVGAYFPNITPHQIKFNPYYMNQLGINGKQYVATHELGHAFGLSHSYLGNIMLSYATSSGQTSLGVQDKSDYDYCWVSISCAL